MSYAENYNFRRVILIDDAEWELPDDVLSEISEVGWPALGSFPDSFYGLIEGSFKVDGGN